MSKKKYKMKKCEGCGSMKMYFNPMSKLDECQCCGLKIRQNQLNKTMEVKYG